MKYIRNGIIATFFVALFVSCTGTNDRAVQYFPNMYRPVGYETYGEGDIFEDNTEAELPVEGTVNRGWMPYGYENSPEGYQNAKAALKNPISYTKDNEAGGQQLYTIYCAICHGDKGNGKGYLVQQEKILGVPSYDDQGRAITEGSIYHVMYYGINSMGSYASQTDENERWQIVQYVEKLKAELEGKEPRVDSLDVANTRTMASPEDNLIPAVNQRNPSLRSVNDSTSTTVPGKTDELIADDTADAAENTSTERKAPASKNFIRDQKNRAQEENN